MNKSEVDDKDILYKNEYICEKYIYILSNMYSSFVINYKEFNNKIDLCLKRSPF